MVENIKNHLKKSHLTIPRKGMETNEQVTAIDNTAKVALNYSPQGDGNFSSKDMFLNCLVLSHLTIPRKGMETLIVVSIYFLSVNSRT